MTDKITMMKDRVLDYMDQEIGKYGNNRMDVKQIGDLADIIKDLAEAEYYCLVSDAMGGSKPQQTMNEKSAYGSSTTMNNSDPISMVRDMLSNANPEMRNQIRISLGI